MWSFRKAIQTKFTNGIDKQWIEEHTPVHTWDMGKLEQYAAWPVFIYGIEKRRHRAHSFIEEWSEFRGTAFTVNSNWIMWKKKLGPGTFPIAMRVDFEMVPKARIKGEVFLIDSQRIKVLDDIMLNGVEFRRKRVEVLIPHSHTVYVHGDPVQNQVITKIPAWMYLGRYAYWSDFLDAGYHFKPCARYSPNSFILKGQYYDFTELELNDD